jgi:hypothetical protein
MSLKRPVLFALRWCGSCVLLILCWTVWLALAALLTVQIWIATHRELALPDFVLRAMEDRLAASGVTARFGRAVFDPTGRFVIEHVQLFAPAHPTPLVTIRAAYASLDFWALLVGDFRPHELRLTGLDLHVPAMLSPSGTDEAVVSDLDGVFRPSRSDYDIALCTFRIAGLSVTGRGGFHLPAAVRSRTSTMPMLDLLMARYLKAGRRLLALRPVLDALEKPCVQLVLTPSEEHGAMVEAELFARSFHPAPSYSVTMADARTVFPLLGEAPCPVHVKLEADGVEWEDRAQAVGVRVDLAGSLVPDRFAFVPQTAQMTAARGTVMAVPLEAPLLDVALARFPRLQAAFSVRAGGSAIAVRSEADVKVGAGTLELSGALTPALLNFARHQSGIAVLKWIELHEPAPVHATVEFAPGWKPARAEADISVRHVTARDVPLDAAAGHVTYAGHDLRVTDLLLLQGDNAAHGSYTMDTATRDYRFLLQGRLRPLDISGWFKAWWPRFWSNFDFTAVPPAADVDITGRWGTAQFTSGFCQVDAARPGIRGMPFDRARTLLFFRPNYFNVFEFTTERAGHSAQGSFELTTDPQRATYRTLDFDGVSDFDPAECARVYGPAGTALVAPYQFAEPPTVRLTGRLEGPAMPGGPHARVHLVLASHGRLTFHTFPLDDLKFTADYTDGILDLRQIETGFAGGAATGKARLDGPPEARVLAFDAILNGADLARVINALDEFQLAGKPASPDRPKGRFLQRASGGRLDAALTAEGRYRQPFSYRGDGYFVITGRELGEIHLLGLLSELLNFTSLRLDAARASFKLDGNKLAFSQVKLTGPTAAIDARGEYLLDAKTLDFKAKVFPLQESGFALTDVLGAMLTPLSNVLELKLTGPLEKPSWEFYYGPMYLLRALTRPAAGEQPETAPAGKAPAPLTPAAAPAPSGKEPPSANPPAPAPQP